MTDTALGHRVFRQALRAPRVAVVIDGDGPWQHWARLALDAVTRAWAGGGFVLVPHRGGTVAPRVLQAVSAYDPDYVVLFRPTLRQYYAAVPGGVPLAVDGKDLGPERQAEILDGAFGAGPLDQPAGDVARERVAAVCSPYRRGRRGSEDDAEAVFWLDAQGSPTAPLAGLPVWQTTASVVSVPPSWTGDAALALTARLGSAGSPPAPGGGPPGPADDAAVLWLVEAAGVVGVPPEEVRQRLDPTHGPYGTLSAFDRTRLDLVGRPRADAPTLAVIGGEPEDFALALLWDRMFGMGVWLPPDWAPDGESARASSIRAALRDRAQTPAGRPRRLLVASVSRAADEVAAVVRRLSDGRRDSPWRDPAVAAARGPLDGRRALRLAVAGQWDDEFAAPVHRPEGTDFAMSAPPPPPQLRNERLAAVPDLPYEVDLQAQGSGMPAGRSLPGDLLLVEGEDPWATWIRSGRDGVAYHARRDGLVLGGASAASRMARPRVQEPDLLAWADGVAGLHGMRFRFSDAGLRVEILTRLAGSRARLCDLLVGPLLPALRAFLAKGATEKAFPKGDGVVLAGRHGLLRFDGLAARTSGPDGPAITRAVADELLTARLLRRGLVLGCGVCQRPSFIAVDDLAQTGRCPRCTAANELVLARWRAPDDEPVWYYDLHPAVRELLEQHGDVPLLLSAWLRENAPPSEYSDAAEVELHPPDGGPVAEADLLAHAEGRVVVAEAKSNDALGSTGAKTREAAAKKALLASTVRADQLILGTRAAAWAAASVDAARHALLHADWPDGQPAALRLVTGLGGPLDQVGDTRVDLDSGRAEPWCDR